MIKWFKDFFWCAGKIDPKKVSTLDLNQNAPLLPQYVNCKQFSHKSTHSTSSLCIQLTKRKSHWNFFLLSSPNRIKHRKKLAINHWCNDTLQFPMNYWLLIYIHSSFDECTRRGRRKTLLRLECMRVNLPWMFYKL